MESVTSDHRKVSGRIGSTGVSTEPKEGGFSKTDPRSRVINRSIRASAYAAFAEEIHRDLNPRGSLERLMVDHVVHSAWKLKSNLEKQSVRDRSEKRHPDTGAPKVRIRSSELDRAARSMKEALDSLESLRARTQPKPIITFDDREVETDIFPNEWPIVPCDSADEVPEDLVAVEEEVPSWQDRLVFDFDVSDVSPVVKGTWITVSHVVSLIVDGWTWADILRSHPELTEDDIRTCVAYTMHEDNSAV